MITYYQHLNYASSLHGSGVPELFIPDDSAQTASLTSTAAVESRLAGVKILQGKIQSMELKMFPAIFLLQFATHVH